jgi:hypothetical protein
MRIRKILRDRGGSVELPAALQPLAEKATVHDSAATPSNENEEAKAITEGQQGLLEIARAEVVGQLGVSGIGQDLDRRAGLERLAVARAARGVARELRAVAAVAAARPETAQDPGIVGLQAGPGAKRPRSYGVTDSALTRSLSRRLHCRPMGTTKAIASGH